MAFDFQKMLPLMMMGQGITNLGATISALGSARHRQGGGGMMPQAQPLMNPNLMMMMMKNQQEEKRRQALMGALPSMTADMSPEMARMANVMAQTGDLGPFMTAYMKQSLKPPEITEDVFGINRYVGGERHGKSVFGHDEADAARAAEARRKQIHIMTGGQAQAGLPTPTTGAETGAEIEAGPGVETPAVPPGTDISEDRGLMGAVKNFVNWLFGAVGGTPFPGQAAGEQALSTLNNRTSFLLTSELKGKPAKWTAEMLQRELIQPNQIGLGPDEMLAKVQHVKGMVDAEYKLAMDILDNPGLLTKNDISKIRQHAMRAWQLSAAYQSAIDQFGSGGGAPAANAGPAPQGIDPEDWQYMPPEKRKLWD